MQVIFYFYFKASPVTIFARMGSTAGEFEITYFIAFNSRNNQPDGVSPEMQPCAAPNSCCF